MSEHGTAPTVDISVVVPFFNEEENIQELYSRLKKTVGQAAKTYELVFVNDGSSDTTAQLLNSIQRTDDTVKVIHLSRNFGHQAAICAGIDHARGRTVALMDGDLQDPPEALPVFLEAWRQGAEVVYAVRTKRKENIVKRAAYFVFYRLLRLISDLDIPLDSGDFCLMDRQVVVALQRLPERLRFVRGLRTFVGFSQVGVTYERQARAAGKPKYTMRTLLTLAIDGLVSFSSYPLRLATYLGFGTAGLAVMLAGWAIYDFLYVQSAPQGWASTLVVLLLVSSAQLICLGIIGEYIRRIFIETKERPTYVIRKVVTSDPAGSLVTGAHVVGSPSGPAQTRHRERA